MINLALLDLSGNQLANLPGSLSTLCTESLDLSKNRLGVAGAQVIASLVGKNKKLKNLRYSPPTPHPPMSFETEETYLFFLFLFFFLPWTSLTENQFFVEGTTVILAKMTEVMRLGALRLEQLR